MNIAGVQIGLDKAPYIIAELSANHGGSIDVAKQSIKLAKESGANAVKIQSYTPDTMTIESNKADFLITDGLLVNIATLVPSTAASATLCVTNKIVFFVFSQINCISTNNKSRVCASRAAKGSSINKTSGLSLIHI